MRHVGAVGRGKEFEQIDDCYDLELACDTSNAQREGVRMRTGHMNANRE